MNTERPEALLEAALDNIRKIKKLSGVFLVGKYYEQGPLPVQRCTVLTVYYRDGGNNMIVYRWRACTTGDNLEQSFEEAFVEVLSHLILNWSEVWNLISTKHQ